MKRLEKIITIVVIIIVLLITMILYNKFHIKQQEARQAEIGDEGEKTELKSELDDVTDRIKFFTVANCVQKYLDYLNKENDSYYRIDEQANKEFIIEQNEINENIFQLLSQEYIKENKVSVEKVFSYVDDISQKIVFIPMKMKVLRNSTVDQYVVYGIEEDTNNKFIRYLYIIINMDNSNSTFSVEPINKEYSDINQISINSNNETIQKNSSNTFNNEKVTYEYTIKKYMDYYKKLALGTPKDAYQLLDKEYRQKRFGSLENYNNYVKQNREDIQKLQCMKYLVNNEAEYVEYVCLDQYQNYYIFDEDSSMNLSLKLDAYTIESDKFKDEYNNYDNNKKVMSNVDKWIKMLNSRDYSAAYDVLDETFKNQNFGSKEKFEEYIKQKYPLHYKVGYMQTSEEKGIYKQIIELSDITGQSQEIVKLTIIMKLKEGTDFVMSFGIE